MVPHIKTVPLCVLLMAGAFLGVGGEAMAQCSGGGRGGGPSTAARSMGASNPINAMTSGANAIAYQRVLAQQQQMLAMRRQMMQQQQQLFAMRQHQFQQIAQQRYDQQQQLQASRLARAHAKRAKRAERIASLKAQRQSGSGGDGANTMLASTRSTPAVASVDAGNSIN